MSEVKSLHQHLSEVMGKVGYVQKKGTMEFKGRKVSFARAEDVFKLVNAELSSRGICVASNVFLERYEENHAVVKMTLAFHKGDQQVIVQGLGEGSDFGDKAVMKANTAALKYTLASAFLISWGDDPEDDSAIGEAATQYEKYLGLIQSVSTKKALEALIPELEGLTTKKAITPGQATKLRKAYSAQAVKLS